MASSARAHHSGLITVRYACVSTTQGESHSIGLRLSCFTTTLESHLLWSFLSLPIHPYDCGASPLIIDFSQFLHILQICGKTDQGT
ncbi:hypothetical protein GDO81_018732 [Engystomops pustulosus]|uniref:Uncharacterized protein n=1 Tax=Engystomops pustulosus TaxID=76066 RepID=A0AAV6YCC2_ENGPU|nr:hypothetical protein GDO81_018732 [Engystomops pustulosus]